MKTNKIIKSMSYDSASKRLVASRFRIRVLRLSAHSTWTGGPTYRHVDSAKVDAACEGTSSILIKMRQLKRFGHG